MWARDFDPMYHTVENFDAIKEIIQAIHNICVNYQEGLITNASSNQGNNIQFNLFVGSNHSGDRKTRHSQT